MDPGYSTPLGPSVKEQYQANCVCQCRHVLFVPFFRTLPYLELTGEFMQFVKSVHCLVSKRKYLKTSS